MIWDHIIYLVAMTAGMACIIVAMAGLAHSAIVGVEYEAVDASDLGRSPDRRDRTSDVGAGRTNGGRVA